MFTGPLEDRFLIRERYSAYSDAAFQGDMDAWLACWSDDGLWEIFGNPVRGKDGLRAQWVETLSTIDHMAFFSEIGSIEVEGDRATARSYTNEIVALKSGDLMKVIGQYSDNLVKQNGVWLFSQRIHTVLIRE